MRTAVITLTSGRHDHLHCQQLGLGASTVVPDGYYVVAMGDDGVRAACADRAFHTAAKSSTVLDIAALPAALPLAAARNHGAAVALSEGAELLVFLDVDCIPAPTLVDRYSRAAVGHPESLLAGPVSYLPPAPSVAGYDLAALHTLASPHPARPFPDDGHIEVGTDYTLFWSLSFAVTGPTWTRIGGFCEDYSGYGAEDTDFAEQARQRRVSLLWIGGAQAFHQYHPPTAAADHARTVIHNATVFFARWGWWPMRPALEELADMGLATRDPLTGCWEPQHA